MKLNEVLAVAGTLELTESELEATQGAYGEPYAFGSPCGGGAQYAYSPYYQPPVYPSAYAPAYPPVYPSAYPPIFLTQPTFPFYGNFGWGGYSRGRGGYGDHDKPPTKPPTK